MISDIDVHELARRLEETTGPGLTLIDVREVDEYAAGHVPGAALVPMSTVPARAVSLDRDRPVHVVCQSGNRSKATASLLESMGFAVVNVAGGTAAWITAGRPVERGLA